MSDPLFSEESVELLQQSLEHLVMAFCQGLEGLHKTLLQGDSIVELV
jgi:hypothetical protein